VTHHHPIRVASLVAYTWLLVSAVSYGVTQSTSVNAYGIQPGTPLYIEILIAPAASVFYLAQFLTYGSVHVCGTFTQPCAWPHTWPGDRVLQNVNTFDDIWFSMFGLTFLLYLASSMSFLKALRAVSVAPIVLGVILFFDDNYWFYQGFSDELTRSGTHWLTNENLTFIGIGVFTVSTVCIRLRRHAYNRARKVPSVISRASEP
jgi:hypothetical protein